MSSSSATTNHEIPPTYISPSDNIQSPTTKKLSAIKGRRFANAKTQTSLFARAIAAKKVGIDATNNTTNSDATGVEVDKESC